MKQEYDSYKNLLISLHNSYKLHYHFTINNVEKKKS